MRDTRNMLAALAALGCLLPIARSAEPRAVQVDVVRIDGKSFRGALESLVPEIALQTPSGPLQLAWNELLEVRPVPGSAEPASQPESRAAADTLWTVTLTDGSRVVGTRASGEQRGFALRQSAARTLNLDIAQIVTLTAPGTTPELLAQLAPGDEAATEDVCLVQRGQNRATVRGTLRRTSEKGIVFERAGKELVVPWERLVALHTARAAARPAAVAVHLRSGDVFCGRISGGDEHGVTLASATLGSLSAEWPEIERIQVRSDRVVILTDLRMARYEMEPLLGVRWEPGVDRSLTGAALLLGGEPVARGLVLHSRALAAYELGGRFRQFAARVGIADEMQSRGDAGVRIRGDGRVLWEAERVRGGEAPRGVLVDVDGVMELTLEIDYGRELDLADHVVFGMARLIR